MVLFFRDETTVIYFTYSVLIGLSSNSFVKDLEFEKYYLIMSLCIHAYDCLSSNHLQRE